MSGISKLIGDNAEHLLRWVPEIIGVFILVGVLYFILQKFIFVPVTGIIKERERKVSDANESEKETIGRYEELLAKYESAVKEARAEALRIRNFERENTERECAVIIEGARLKAETILKNALADLQLETERAKIVLERESHEMADMLSERILSRQGGLGGEQV